MTCAGYFIWNETLRLWLNADKRTWTHDFGSAACFGDAQLAERIRERESRDTAATYVLGWMH